MVRFSVSSAMVIFVENVSGKFDRLSSSLVIRGLKTELILDTTRKFVMIDFLRRLCVMLLMTVAGEGFRNVLDTLVMVTVTRN